MVGLLLLGLILASGAGADEAEAPTPTVSPRPLNVLLISIDDLRADRLGVYGSGRPTSPAFDRLARDSVLFENAYSTSSWTLPAHATMFTGLHPRSHRATVSFAKTDPAVAVLPEILRERGYRTRAITSGGWMTEPYGFGRGFEEFEVAWSPNRGVRRVIEELDEIGTEDPYFFFFHTFGVHCPFHVPPEYRAPFDTRSPEDHMDLRAKCGDFDLDSLDLTPGQLAFIRDRYDAGIRRTDDKLAKLFAYLRGRGDFARTIVIVTSDHGEEFREHGRMGHGRALYTETLRVPLLMRIPGLTPRRVATPTSLVDLAPTVLDLLGLPAEGMEGESLAARLRKGDAADDARPIFAETNLRGEKVRTVLHDGEQLIRDEGKGRTEVYSLLEDPAQKAPREGDASELTALLESHFAGERRPPTTVEPTEERLRQLRALGYVQ